MGWLGLGWMVLRLRLAALRSDLLHGLHLVASSSISTVRRSPCPPASCSLVQLVSVASTTPPQLNSAAAACPSLGPGPCRRAACG